MRFRVRPVHDGVGFLASTGDDPGLVIHATGFDEAVLELASKHPSLCPEDGSQPQLQDLEVVVIHEEYGQYLLDVTRQ